MSKDKQQDDKQQASLALMQWASAQRDRRAFLQLSAAGASIASLSTTAAFAQAATQGVTKDQIVLGHIGDLSGPLVSLSKPSVNGMRMRVKEINDQGGINGRKIKLNVEDSGYDPKKGVLAAQKLLSQDKVFAMIGTLGTVISLPTIQLCVQRGVPHLFPITAHHGNYEPFHKLKFASFPPYPETTAAGLKEILRQKGAKRIGILYQDDEFGLEILRGTEMALKAMPGTELVEKTSYKRGATDFSSQMQKLLAAKVDFIVLGTIIRETIGAIATGRKMGYAGDFFGSSAAYMPAVAKAGGKVVEGFYAMSEAPTPYRDDPKNNKLLNDWMDRYKAEYKEDADLWSVVGWVLIDMFAKAAEKAGAGLNTDSFIKALESNPYPRTFLGTSDYAWGPDKRLGNTQMRIAQIQNGRWVTISDFIKG